MEWKQIFNTWGKVFINLRYSIVTIIIALLFYSTNVLISSWSSLISFYSVLGFFGTINFFFTLFIGFKETMMFHSFISLIIIGILLGVLFSLIGYKVSLGQGIDGKKISLFGGLGFF